MNKPNILWITMDAVRKDRLSCYGYKKKLTPNIDKIAQHSILFENAFANAPWTLPSVASMFTGLYPSQHGALNEKTKLRRNVKTIAEILAEKGYSTVIITQNDGWITPYYGLTRGFKKIYDIEKLIEETLKIKLPKSKKKKLFIRMFVKYFIGYGVLTKKILRQLTKNTTEPWFIYVHLMDAHMPYEPFSLPFVSIIRYLVFYKNWKEKMQLSWAGLNKYTTKELKILKQLYDKTIRDLDEQIKNYHKMLSETDTILIITADHGEHINEDGFIGHQFSFSDDLLEVPLIIYHPQIGGKCLKGLFETKNIFYLIKDMVEKEKLDYFYEKDYVYGESREIEPIFKKLSKINPSLSLGGAYIRTKKVKYVKYLNGKEELYKVNGMEEKFENPTILQNMRMLLQIKERELQRKSIKDVLK